MRFFKHKRWPALNWLRTAKSMKGLADLDRIVSVRERILNRSISRATPKSRNLGTGSFSLAHDGSIKKPLQTSDPLEGLPDIDPNRPFKECP